MLKEKENYSPKEYKHYDRQTVSTIDYYIEKGRLNEALDLALNYIKEYPNDDYARYCVAKIYSVKGDSQKALDYIGNDYEHRHFYNKSAKLRALVIYVNILSNCNQVDKALLLLSDAIREDQEFLNIKIRMEYLRLLYDCKEYDQVIENANIYLKRKNHPAILEFKGKALMIQKKYSQALQALMEADLCETNTNVNTHGRHYYIGSCNYELFRKTCDYKYLKDAEIYFKKALTATTKSYFYYLACNCLANINNNLENPEEAIYYGNQVIENANILKNPVKVDETRRSIAYAYLFQGKNDLAYDMINQIESPYIKECTLVRYLYYTKQYDEFLKRVNWVLAEAKDAGFNTHIQEYICVLISLEKYEEALYIIEWIKDDLSQSFYERVIAFIKKQTGKAHDYYRYYTARQIANYSFEDAVRHILDGHIDVNERAYFNDKAEVVELMQLAKEAIKDMDYIPNVLVNKYILVQDGAGQDKFGKVNGLAVVAIMGTTDIITLYPVSNRCLSDYEDEYQSKNVKRLSQIEKFNQKYGKK